MEGFQAFFSNTSRFSKSILPFKEQKHATLVNVGVFEAVKDHINWLSINALYSSRNMGYNFDPPPNLLDTPT